MNLIEKYSINIVNKYRPKCSQIDINEYNEGAAKSLLDIFNKHYESLSYMFSLMKKTHLENTQTYLDMKDKLNKLSIDD
ncbi:MAG: hypothetical protein MSA15_18455 [Clostridium sp.]|nr:hypothetical protein [Clostridium sp.]